MGWKMGTAHEIAEHAATQLLTDYHGCVHDRLLGRDFDSVSMVIAHHMLPAIEERDRLAAAVRDLRIALEGAGVTPGTVQQIVDAAPGRRVGDD